MAGQGGTENRPTIKGIGFLGLFKFVKERPGGNELMARVMAALPAEAGQVCGKKVIAIGDYPYEAFIQLIRTVDKICGRGDLSLCYDLGVYAADRDFESFFGGGAKKIRIKPADLFRDCGVFWKSYYQNAGYMKTESSDPDRSVICIYDFPQMDPAHCRFMVGWMAQAMIKAGAQWIDYTEARCPSTGGPFHEFVGSWRLKES